MAPHWKCPLLGLSARCAPFSSQLFVSRSDIPEDRLDLDCLPRELKSQILHHLLYEHIFQLKSVSKSWKEFVESYELLHTLSLRESPKLTACYFFIANGAWHWAGFDPCLSKWRRLPPLAFLPPQCSPDTELFKEFLFCTKAGLVCVNFSKSPDVERLIVFNPLSRQWRELPPLNHRRNPVLMHMLVDSTTESYQLVLAGSSRSGDEAASKLTEIYDSKTEKWEEGSTLPGPAFALNEYQSGVHQNGSILCIGFVELPDGAVVKGILGYKVQERTWWKSPLPSAVMHSTILQLVESHGEVYLFSERDTGRVTEHCIDRLEWTELKTCSLVNVVRRSKEGGRSLEVYPEFALVPYSEFQLCVYNTVDHTGEVYDIRYQGECQALPALPEMGFRGELGFFSLNPMAFVVEPRFSTKV